jgi:starch synthase
MMFVIRYALQIYHKDPSSWDTLIQNAMSMDFGWNQSAKAYKKLYRKILRE